MSKAASSYKNFLGGYQELLTKNNYETWSPIIKRKLQGKDYWGYVDATQRAPDPLPAGSPATDMLLHKGIEREYRQELSACGAYIFNACSKVIQERYLSDIDLSSPAAMWTRLAEKLQGKDEESRSRLLTKFMTMKKDQDTTIEQFAKKLQTIQGLLNGNVVAANRLITDKMVIEQICKNAGSALDYLTNSIRTTVTLTPADVLKRYELAEEARDREALETKTNDTVSALYANKDNRGNSRDQRGGQAYNTRNKTWNGSSRDNSTSRQFALPVCPST